MKKIKYAFILATFIGIFNACTKDVAGPTGPTGSQGPQGPSASYSVTIDSIEPTQWPTQANSNNQFTFALNKITGLTNPDFNVIEVYYSTVYNSASTWYELPAANLFTTGDALTYYYTTYQVTMAYLNTGGTPPAVPLYFKIVVINQP